MMMLDMPTIYELGELGNFDGTASCEWCNTEAP